MARQQIGRSEPDSVVIARVIQRDQFAGEEFVARFARRVYRILHNAGLSKEDCEDLFQTVFVHLWREDLRRLRTWQGRGAFCVYLDRIVVRLILEKQRERRPITATWEDDLESRHESEYGGGLIKGENLVDDTVSRQRASAVVEILRKMPTRDAEIIRRKHLQGQSYQEIALALGITSNNVGVSLHRAEKRLVALLENSYPRLFVEKD